MIPTLCTNRETYSLCQGNRDGGAGGTLGRFYQQYVSDPICALRTRLCDPQTRRCRTGGRGEDGPSPQRRRHIGSDIDLVPLVGQTPQDLPEPQRGPRAPPALPQHHFPVWQLGLPQAQDPGTLGSLPPTRLPHLQQRSSCYVRAFSPQTCQVYFRGSFPGPPRPHPQQPCNPPGPLGGPSLCLNFVCILTYQSN